MKEKIKGDSSKPFHPGPPFWTAATISSLLFFVFVGRELTAEAVKLGGLGGLFVWIFVFVFIPISIGLLAQFFCPVFVSSRNSQEPESYRSIEARTGIDHSTLHTMLPRLNEEINEALDLKKVFFSKKK